MKKTVKISSSAYRVLFLLLKLNEKDYCVDELNRLFLYDPNIERLFTRDVIVKYINTLKSSGYDITRLSEDGESSYRLNKAPVRIDLSGEEVRAIALLQKYAHSLHQEKFIRNCLSIQRKIKRYLPDDQVKMLETLDVTVDFTEFDRFAGSIKEIEQYITRKQKVELRHIIPSGEELSIVELIDLKYEPNNVKVLCYNTLSNQMKSIKLENILEIRQLPGVSGLRKMLSPVIFKVKGRLAKVYRAYEDEKVTEMDDKGEITVTSYSEDLDLLLKRLLKYGENCEITYPKLARNAMEGLVKNCLDNYDRLSKSSY